MSVTKMAMAMNKMWDVIIIGSGFGGSMTALQLAKAGLDVLVLERGGWVARDDSAWDTRAILIDRKYRSRTPYRADQWLGRGMVYPDAAVGGNSVFYGAASFRMREADFAMRSRNASDGNKALPYVDWPIAYTDLAPYYDQAEALLGVAGATGVDPTEPRRSGPYPQKPSPYSLPAKYLAEAAASLGMRPFPIPLAIHFDRTDDRAACIHCSTCDLFPCKICAKNDLAVTVLPEAMHHGATVRPYTLVKRLVKNGDTIAGVECLDLRRGETSVLTCRLCIVSCGAIGSAKLLLQSGLAATEPNGALIGRYLMRHCSGIVIGVFPFRTNPDRQFNKQVGITDFYFGHPEGVPPQGNWGMIQALQVPPPEYIVSLAPFPVGTIGAKSTPYQMYLLCIAEDLPNAANRVEIDPTRRDDFGIPIAQVRHRYDRRDLQARRGLYREAARILRAAGAVLRVRKPINTYSHAIGTCRFGTDPQGAVLDPWCRFFNIPNLFVVDGSFMPTSGGVNPSLTIAANGLRVGHYITESWSTLVKKTDTHSRAEKNVSL